MVNITFIPDGQAGAERRLILSYAPVGCRAGLAALLALDDGLASILRFGRDPMVTQLRLTWWHDALRALDDRSPPAEPVLRALHFDVVPKVMGKDLAGLVEGWEELLDAETLDDACLLRFADRRGGRLFAMAGRLLAASSDDPLNVAGRGWALADLAAHLSDAAAATRAAMLAQAVLDEATSVRWSRRGRALGAMAHLARITDASAATRTARALWHRLTGG